MQFSQILAVLALTVSAVWAAPPTYAPPPPPPTPPKPYVPGPPGYPGGQPPKPSPPPFITNNNQANTCSSGSPFCCSPSSTGGTTCVSSVGVACNTVSICCNNFANAQEANQSCSGISMFAQPVTYPGYPQY